MIGKSKLPSDKRKPDHLGSLERLLGNLTVPGTSEQIEGFRTRIGELAELNGEAWVRRHARRLLVQWEMALKMADIEKNPD